MFAAHIVAPKLATELFVISGVAENAAGFVSAE